MEPVRIIGIIGQQLLDGVTREAKAASRLRKNLNLHTGDEARCHRLFNAMEPDSYIPPHCHLGPEKDETIIVVRGRLGVIFFDDLGAVREQAILSPGGDLFGVHIAQGEFHTFVSLESGTVFFESKAGPYRPMSPEEKAPWAPGEGSADAAVYLASLRKVW
jgi:cupin fold WbuC family metalloprotein